MDQMDYEAVLPPSLMVFFRFWVFWVMFRFQNFLILKLFYFFWWFRIQYRKKLVSEKVLDSVSKNIDIEKSIRFGIGNIWYWKNFQIRFRSDFGYRHTLVCMSCVCKQIWQYDDEECSKSPPSSALIVFRLLMRQLLSTLSKMISLQMDTGNTWVGWSTY